MQGVLAISHLSGHLDGVRLWNDLLSAPCCRRTVVQETEITGVGRYLRWGITRRNNHSDCLQKLGWAYWVRECVVCSVNMANELLQVQMDDASHCPDRTLYARDRQLGKDFMSSSAGIGLSPLPLDCQTEDRSSPKGWILLLLARF